jgi:hypothetical protein
MNFIIKHVSFILSFLAAIPVFLLGNLGMDWINFGHGLHPAVAFPIATLFACFILFIRITNFFDIEEDHELTREEYYRKW